MQILGVISKCWFIGVISKRWFTGGISKCWFISGISKCWFIGEISKCGVIGGISKYGFVGGLQIADLFVSEASLKIWQYSEQKIDFAAIPVCFAAISDWLKIFSYEDKKGTTGHWKSAKNAHFQPKNILASTIFNFKKVVFFCPEFPLSWKIDEKKKKKRVFLQQQSDFLHKLLVECESFNFEKYE